MGRTGGGGSRGGFSHSSHSMGRSHSSHSFGGGSSKRSSFGGSPSGGFRPRNSRSFIPIFMNMSTGGRGSFNGNYNDPFGKLPVDKKYLPKKKKKRWIGPLICVLLIVIILLAIIGASAGDKSTIERERLTSTSFTASCVKDDLSWIRMEGSSEERVGQSLEKFWAETGIQPYVVLLPYDRRWESANERYDYADKYYENNINNEYTMLVMYFDGRDEYTDGWWEMTKGLQVSSIMDSEATEIFWNKLDKHWYSSETVSDAIVNTFNDTSKVIMRVSTTANDIIKIILLGAILLILIIGIITIMNLRRKHAAENAAETERILKTPLENLDADDDPLVNKYSKGE